MIKKKVSRQRRWAVKQKQLGNCMICGKPRSKISAAYCLDHNIWVREYQRMITNANRRSLSCKSYIEEKKIYNKSYC